MKDPNKPKKVKQAPMAKPKPVDNATLSTVLNVQCCKTGQPINVNEYVKVFNWGMDVSLLGIGRFTWDDFERKFDLEMNKEMTEQIGGSCFEIETSYDAFRAPVEKLTPDELNEIVMPNL